MKWSAVRAQPKEECGHSKHDEGSAPEVEPCRMIQTSRITLKSRITPLSESSTEAIEPFVEAEHSKKILAFFEL